MAELVETVDAALAAKSRDDWGPIFDEHRLIWGPVLGLHEVTADPQAEAIGLFPTIEHRKHGDYRTVRAPMRIRDVDITPQHSSPRVGEHTRSVLASAGFDDATIDQLITDGHVVEQEA